MLLQDAWPCTAQQFSINNIVFRIDKKERVSSSRSGKLIASVYCKWHSQKRKVGYDRFHSCGNSLSGFDVPGSFLFCILYYRHYLRRNRFFQTMCARRSPGAPCLEIEPLQSPTKAIPPCYGRRFTLRPLYLETIH